MLFVMVNLELEVKTNMNAWLMSTCSDFFGAAVPPAFVFAVFDCLVCMCFKFAFLGKASVSVSGGRVTNG